MLIARLTLSLFLIQSLLFSNAVFAYVANESGTISTEDKSGRPPLAGSTSTTTDETCECSKGDGTMNVCHYLSPPDMEASCMEKCQKQTGGLHTLNSGQTSPE